MCDDDRRAPGQRHGQGLLHGGLVLGVEVAGGLVQDHDGRVLQEQAGDGQPLLLASRHPVATLADHGVKTVGERTHDVQDPGGATGVVQLGVGRIGSGVPEVGAHRVVEQVRVLGDHADPGPQVVLAEGAQVDAVQGDRPERHVVEPRYQCGQGALAGAGRPDHGQHPAGTDVEVQVVQHHSPRLAGCPIRLQGGHRGLVCRRIPERHPVQGQVPLDRLRVHGIDGVGHRVGGVQDLEHTLE